MKNLLKSAKLASFVSALLLMVVSVALASEEGGHDGKKMFEFMWKTIDFAALVILLWWLAASKIKAFFVGRRQDIKDSLENAAQQKKDAEEKYKEYSDKIDKASAEIDGIFEMIKAQGVAEKQKIVEEAEKVAKKIKEDSQMRTSQELKKASDQLRAEAVILSVQMAEEIIKKNIAVQDHEVIVKEYMEKVVNKN
ncbi:MAG: ATP synthase F0 subunit B [Syntrophaceae bacterium]|nr:ATP synthase F0 subunit B [Syntrophaceae bacterium]